MGLMRIFFAKFIFNLFTRKSKGKKQYLMDQDLKRIRQSEIESIFDNFIKFCLFRQVLFFATFCPQITYNSKQN